MKNIALFLIAAFAALFAGCASDTINAASTKLQVTDSHGKSFQFAFPKELDAQKFDLTIDPRTGAISLKSDAIRTSSQGVIDSAGKAQAQAMSDMAKALEGVVSTVLPIVAPQVAPLLKKPTPPAPEDTPAAPEPAS